MRKVIFLLILFSPFALANSNGNLNNVEGDFTEVLIIHAKICSAENLTEMDKQSPQTAITSNNILIFLDDPVAYSTEYRKKLDDQFIALHGGIKELEKHAKKTARTPEDVATEVKSMLRWNARNYMVALNYEFCANALALQNVILTKGCQADSNEEIDFTAAAEFCADPFQY